MKVGIIGCGGMGTTHYLSYKALSEKMDVEITAIADCRQECLDKAAEVWPEASRFHMGMDLINNTEVDVIDICLPSYLHADHAIAAMEKGCHTFVEKPVCLTKSDCDRLLETEKKTGVKVMVGQVVRFFDEYKYLKKAFVEQKYGKLKSIVMNRTSGDVTWGYEDWFHDINKSGSVVLDLHIHDLDFLRYMIGEPDEITVNSTSFDSGMPNQIITNYKFGDVFASVEGSWDISSKMPFEAYYRACFEKATIVNSRLHSPHLTVYHKDGTIEYPDLTPEYSKENTSSEINIASLGPYYSEIKYFLDCIVENKQIKIAPLSEGTKSVLLALLELEQALSR